MSQTWKPTRTNKTPWMDKINLITVTETVDADGYVTKVETERTVRCTFTEGINRNEFYEAMKSGMQLSAVVEMWQNEYQNEKKCTYNNKKYKIVRSYETGRGTVELSLSGEK